MFRIVVTGAFHHPQHRKEVARIIRSTVVRNHWCANHAPKLVIDFRKPIKPFNPEKLSITIVYSHLQRFRRPKGHRKLAGSICQAVFEKYTHFQGNPFVELHTSGDGSDLRITLIKEEEPNSE